MEQLQLPGLEAIWIQIKCQKRKYLIGTFYRKHKSDAYWELTDQSIGNAMDLNIYTVIAGDFNLDILSENKFKIETLKTML